MLLYIPQVLALAQLLLISLIWAISLWLPGFSSSPGDAVVPTLIALGLALPLLLNLLLSARRAVAVLGQSRRVRQLRAGGEAVCVMTDYVRTATSAKGAGAVMARPIIDELGRRRVVIIGIAANQSLVDHYLELGAVHDTPPTASPGGTAGCDSTTPPRDYLVTAVVRNAISPSLSEGLIVCVTS